MDPQAIPLRGLHLPEAVGLWPLAPGWWLLLLILVLAMPAAGGAHRWLHLGVLRFQPSELAKLVAVVFMAYILTKKDGQVNDPWAVPVPGAVVIGTLAFLIVIEPEHRRGLGALARVTIERRFRAAATASGALLAISLAQRIASSISSSWGTTRFARPSRSMSAASSSRPISRSIRSTMAAWIAIFVAWNRRCPFVSCSHGRGRLISPGPGPGWTLRSSISLIEA